MTLWRIQNIESGNEQLDFQSSGQGRPTVTALYADGERIANALELTVWTAPIAQVFVCEDCGIVGCAPGGWIAARALGECVVWLPAFEELLADTTEHQPPPYLDRRGIPFFDAEHAATLRTVLPCLPPGGLSAPSWTELIRALQWTAPAGILGALPGAVELRVRDVLAVSHGDRAEQLENLRALLREATPGAAASVRRLRGDEELVTFYIEAPGHPHWTPLALVDGEPYIRLGEQWIARPTHAPD